MSNLQRNVRVFLFVRAGTRLAAEHLLDEGLSPEAVRFSIPLARASEPDVITHWGEKTPERGAFAACVSTLIAAHESSGSDDMGPSWHVRRDDTGAPLAGYVVEARHDGKRWIEEDDIHARLAALGLVIWQPDLSEIDRIELENAARSLDAEPDDAERIAIRQAADHAVAAGYELSGITPENQRKRLGMGRSQAAFLARS